MARKREADVLTDWFSGRQGAQRIFISYRREDTQWAAGRLSDSLASYFGDDRVFRDIEDIAGGAKFGDVIHETLAAADAVVVLIGKDWLRASNDQGMRRLEDPDDWVAREIAGALDKGVPVYPVLLEGTPMPREAELPEALWPLTRYNALSISDSRWQEDVARLAKIVAFDIPSATERLLQAVNVLISAALYSAIAFTVSLIFLKLFDARPEPDGDTLNGWKFNHLFDKIGDTEKCAFPLMPWSAPLELWQSGVIFVVVVVSSVLLLVFRRYVDVSRRVFVDAAAGVGCIGTFVAYMLLYSVCEQYESMVITYMGLIVAPLMLALVTVSGFKAK